MLANFLLVKKVKVMIGFNYVVINMQWVCSILIAMVMNEIKEDAEVLYGILTIIICAIMMIVAEDILEKLITI